MNLHGAYFMHLKMISIVRCCLKMEVGMGTGVEQETGLLVMFLVTQASDFSTSNYVAQFS